MLTKSRSDPPTEPTRSQQRRHVVLPSAGRSRTHGMPCSLRCFASPMPDSIKSCGDSRAPALKITCPNRMVDGLGTSRSSALSDTSEKTQGFFSKGCLLKHWIWFWAFFGICNIRGMDIHKLVGGFNLPLWKMMEWKSVVHLIPNTWSHKIHVPNHQPVMVMYINPY